MKAHFRRHSRIVCIFYVCVRKFYNPPWVFHKHWMASTSWGRTSCIINTIYIKQAQITTLFVILTKYIHTQHTHIALWQNHNSNRKSRVCYTGTNKEVTAEASPSVASAAEIPSTKWCEVYLAVNNWQHCCIVHWEMFSCCQLSTVQQITLHSLVASR